MPRYVVFVTSPINPGVPPSDPMTLWAVLTIADSPALAVEKIVSLGILPPSDEVHALHLGAAESFTTTTDVTVEVAPPAAPIPSFTFDPQPPVVGEAVQFDATGSFSRASEITRYDWKWGDGTPLARNAGPLPSHTYEVEGAYTVNLALLDKAGLTGVLDLPIRVVGDGNG